MSRIGRALARATEQFSATSDTPRLDAEILMSAALGIALHLRQVHSAVALLAVFYLVVAIAPWTAILFL